MWLVIVVVGLVAVASLRREIQELQRRVLDAEIASIEACVRIGKLEEKSQSYTGFEE